MATKKNWNDLTPKEKISGVSALMFFIFAAWLAVSLFGKEKLPPFSIEDKECIGSIKCSYDVRLSGKISEKEIAAVANEIKKSSPSVEAIFILYYLPCMRFNDGAWASSHFNPDLKIEIQDYMLVSNPTCPN